MVLNCRYERYESIGMPRGGRHTGPRLTGAQLRAARGLLNWSVSELAEQTGLAVNTIRKAEATNSEAPINAANALLLQSTLQQAGVVFIPADDLGAGVRLASPEALPHRPRRRD